MRLKISLKKFLWIVSIIALISILVFLYVKFRPIKTVHYNDVAFTFRDDTKKASKVKVYPDEKTLHDLFWDMDIENVTILFKPVDEKMGYYTIESFELTYKLSLMYMLNGMRKEFNAKSIDSYETIRDSPLVLQIALVHPELTDKTYVETKGHIVYIHAKDYKDFDLATIKTILVAMNITV